MRENSCKAYCSILLRILKEFKGDSWVWVWVWCWFLCHCTFTFYLFRRLYNFSGACERGPHGCHFKRRDAMVPHTCLSLVLPLPSVLFHRAILGHAFLCGQLDMLRLPQVGSVREAILILAPPHSEPRLYVPS